MMSSLEPQDEPQDEPQLDSINTPSPSADAEIHAYSHGAEIGNAAVSLTTVPISRDFYRSYQAILLGRAGLPPAPELAPPIYNLRDGKCLRPVGRHPISAV